jgi:glycosyltransferase involved in cell wall biosynthesis
VLSKIDDIIILCKNGAEGQRAYYDSPYKKIKIERFSTNVKLIEKQQQYIQGIYELIRNWKLIISLGYKLSTILFSLKRKNIPNIKLYTVSSPLTVPFICLLIGKLFQVKLEVLGLHDLEPETAIHIKKLNPNSLVLKIEYLLEKIVSRSYNKIIVTSNSQAQRIINRTHISKNKICVIPNTVDPQVNVKNHILTNDSLRKIYGLNTSDFVLGYITTFSYDYTTSGVIKVLKILSSIIKKIPNLKFILVGDGDGLNE